MLSKNLLKFWFRKCNLFKPYSMVLKAFYLCIFYSKHILYPFAKIKDLKICVALQ